MDAKPKERPDSEWLTTAATGRQWKIEPVWSSRSADNDTQPSGPVNLLNYYAMRYGYDLVVAS